MAKLKSKFLFFTTSPRTPLKMLPEIDVLINNFNGQIWNKENQIKFINLLSKNENFNGEGFKGDLAFSARDRINRAPKALGFIDLKPVIKLTEAGEKFLHSSRKEEILLRQLLKFQLPSPYHTADENEGLFFVKPYLEIIRLIYVLDGITFDELMLFGMQLTNYNFFDSIVNKIKLFRSEKLKNKGQYKKFFNITLENILLDSYKVEVLIGKTATRESNDNSLDKFIKTKKSNLRDYTDACFRYLRATGLFAISHTGRSLSVMTDKINDVKFILESVNRNPIFVNEEQKYKDYLFDSQNPILYIDNKENLIDYILKYSKKSRLDLINLNVEELKDLRDLVIKENKDSIISAQVKELKSYNLYMEVIDTYNEIISDNLYDVPLMFEWNTWRAMTMLDGGKITGNFKIDDAGQPLSTAIGNVADIECDYGDFGLTVEVTMQRGQRQYETEGEPVARHLAKYKKEKNKIAYCLFIAPTINDACIAHFYTLSKINISYYGGKSLILPISLDVFMKMIEDSYSAKYVPDPSHIKNLFDYAEDCANKVKNEKEWYLAIQKKALNWLAA